MDWATTITALIGAFSGLAALVASRKKDSAQAKKISYEADGILADNYEKLLLRLESKIETMEQREMANMDRVRNLEIECMELRSKIQLLESAHMDSPIPMWLKDTNGKMLALNKAYEKAFLVPIGLTTNDYIGKTDVEIWGEDISKKYIEHDNKVVRNKRTIDVMEPMLLDGKVEMYRVIKWPRLAGSVVIGIAGMAIPEKK